MLRKTFERDARTMLWHITCEEGGGIKERSGVYFWSNHGRRSLDINWLCKSDCWDYRIYRSIFFCYRLKERAFSLSFFKSIYIYRVLFWLYKVFEWLEVDKNNILWQKKFLIKIKNLIDIDVYEKAY